MNKLMMIALAAFAAANSFGAIRAVAPDMYAGNTNAWQLGRHREKMAIITNGGSRVVFIGDSITHFWEGAGSTQWKKYFAGEPYRALDLGISADRTEHVLWRITEGKELDGYEAKCILLMIGTNNSGHFPFEKEPPIDTILGINQILKTIRAKQPTAKIVLTAIFPRGHDVSDSYRKRNEVVNREIAKFADGKTIFWCDFNEQFLTPDGQLPRGVFPDLLHPGPHGYEIWAAAVKPYIDYALSDGKLPAPSNRYASCVRAENFRMDEPASVYPVARIVETDWWLGRLYRNRSQIAEANGAFDLVFFGDSITHNWEAQGKETFAELLKTYSILNIGYSGDRTQHLVWRGENGELDGYKAKCIMLMIGTNNSGDTRSAHDIALGVRRVLDVVARKQPQAKVLLLPIFPRGASDADARRKITQDVNAEITTFADGEKVIWVDFNAKFLDEKGSVMWCMPDGLHPNAEAYRDIWLPAVLPHFQRICGK